MLRFRVLSFVALGSLSLTSCGDDDAGAKNNDAGKKGQDASVSPGPVGPNSSDAGISSQSSGSTGDAGVQTEGDAQAVGGDGGVSSQAQGDAAMTAIPTFYDDVLPLIEANCLGCHVPEGIGPMRLDTYESAKDHAAAIRIATQNRIMPPYLVKNDESCGDFANAPYLSDDELKTIRNWVESGTPEGTPRDVERPELGELPATNEVSTPNFTPVAGGGVLDAHDDYRCFLLDPPEVGKFITGYQVIPGNTAIVHHVVVNLIDMDAPSEYPSGDGGVLTNGEAIAAHDALDPDVEGWKCFGLAGDGIEVDSVPVVWAPGQGVVRYPNQAGIPMGPNHKLAVQVHYNLEDEGHHGESDQTKVRFELKEPEQVPNVGLYIPTDPLLNSLLSGDEPDVLPPGKASTKYVWQRSFEELGLGGIAEFQLWGVFPHMHETGNKYTLEVLRSGSEEPQCAAQVNKWDFHWQHLYFYREAQVVTPEDSVRVTCDYDTRGKTEAILPGWGTQNEMCFLGMFVTLPNQ